MVGYNVQTAVDTKNHLIVSHEVIDVSHDCTQLASMSAQAQEASLINVISFITPKMTNTIVRLSR
ncbi:hypothetical protein C7W93_00115 [Glaciimonas sp. PCH181]|nr:hypothetical protein C7W93_00115 [Glaciimonas sp. PCH181]